jgi:diguanylate cyclase (GGDEF)-like protein
MQDELTGLANRRRLEQDLGAALAAGDDPQVALLDINGFKAVNDQLGHSVGDRLLIAVGGRLSATLGARALVARMGGDEFAILLPDAAAADGVVERIAATLHEPVHSGDHELLVSASIGLADGADTGDPLEVLRRADIAMYAAKGSGEPVRRYCADLDRQAGEEARVGAEPRTALDAGQFRLVYQPIVELPHGRLVAVEALVRWEHPERGMISPADFIPLAEDTGLIVPLGRQILRDACRQASVFQAAGNPRLTVSVNVSARQLQRAEFVDEVREALLLSGIPPETLVLELTESVMVQDTDLAVLRLDALHDLGVHIAIDDFGTGYSSLNYLRQFPIDILKIDRSFVRGAHEDAEVLALTRTILDLAAGLGLRPVAEGVEVAEELALLRGLGCGHGQGFLFARPMDVDATLDYLRGRKTQIESASVDAT